MSRGDTMCLGFPNQPGNANLPIGVAKAANREIGVPGLVSIHFDLVQPHNKRGTR